MSHYESISNNNRTISSEYHIAITSERSSYVSKEHCPIIEKYRVCHHHALIDITKDGCIHNTLWGNNASCPYTEVEEPMQIKRINTNTLLIKNAIYPITLNSSCNPAFRTITGTVLINFQDCTIIVNNETYDTEKTTGYDETILIPTIGIIVNETTLFKPPDISQIHKLNIENREHITEIRNYQTIIKHTTIGGFFLLSIMSCSLGAWIIISTKRNKPTKIQVNVDNQKQSPKLPRSSKADLLHYLKIRDESFHRGEELSTSPTGSSPKTPMML